MKNLRYLALVLLAAVAMSGCDAFKTLTRSKMKTAQGRPYELIVVCPQQSWDGPLGDTLRAVLTAPVPYLNQTEPRFDVMRVNERGFTGPVADHRNILKVLADPQIATASMAVQYNVTAEPQIVLTLQGPSDKALAAYLSEHRASVVQVLEQAERDRAISYAERFNEKNVQDTIRKLFGVEMTIPKGYVVAAAQADFLWARSETAQTSQGFFLYSYPYTGKESLSAAALLAARNKFAARIPGPADGSYMTTSEAFEPDYRMFRLEGRIWCELRGFWDVKGDFMGGPFVSYSTVDTQTNRVFTLDCYIFSPRQHKRNLMRGVENLLYMVKFPEAAPAAPAQQ